MEGYEYLDHTGDLGIRAYGETLKALFTHAAQGLFEAIADVNTVQAVAQVEIEVSAESAEDLMVAWLDELNFRHEVEEVFFRQVEIQRISEKPWALSAVAYGEPADFTRHVVYTEIKGVTYHQLIVEQTPEGKWFAQVIFDL
ncbi:MAG: archease [Candidatus Poribacteria bacterium]|nr:archease [Candidatus Poribacteria bacterium]